MKFSSKRFSLCFFFLLAISGVPFYWFYGKIVLRLQAFHHQKLVDLKREKLEAMQEAFFGFQNRLIEQYPKPATQLVPLSETPLAPDSDRWEKRPWIYFILRPDKVYFLTGDFEVSPVPEEKISTRSIGNVIRKLSGYSLISYPDVRGRAVYGVWRWDHGGDFGLVLESPAEEMESFTRDLLKEQKRRKIDLLILCFFSYGAALMIGAGLLSRLLSHKE